MMRYTVENEYYGGGFNGEICAKTGTAEVGGGEAAHAWVTGFSRDESCPLAFAVIIEMVIQDIIQLCLLPHRL